MLKADSWFERYSRRYEWANQAYERFVGLLTPDLMESLNRDEQVTIAVYGATQVGKTTLILDLLGLETSSSAEAPRVLRGGQKLGYSATSMPIRYGRSDDDYWHIAGKGPLSPDDACEVLKVLRRSMETGLPLETETLDIRIPLRLFLDSLVEKRTISLSIIDIPGTDSQNESERQWVTALSRRYVSVADLVLLVGRADDLGFLNEKNLEHDFLAEWSSQPSRYCVVLTFSFSQESLLQSFQGREMDVDSVRDIFIDEMNTHDYVFPDCFRNNLYVLEFGDSARSLESQNPEFHRRIADVSAKFRMSLVEAIENAGGPYARLFGAFQLRRVIHARIEKINIQRNQYISQFNEVRKELLREVSLMDADLIGGEESNIVKHISNLRINIEREEGKRKEIQACLASLEKFDWASLFKVKVANSIKRGEVFSIKRDTVITLRDGLENLAESQKSKINGVSGDLLKARIVPAWLDHVIPSVGYSRDHLLEIEEVLDGYSFDYYLTSGGFLRDYNALQAAFDEGANVHGDLLKAKVKQLLKDKLKIAEREIKDVYSKINVIDHYREKLDSLWLEEKNIIHDIDLSLSRMDESQRIVSSFENILNQAFFEELKKVENDSLINPSAEQRFYSLMHRKLLSLEIERMYDGSGF